MPSLGFRVVLDTNTIVGAGTAWLDHGVPAPDPNVYRRMLIRVAHWHAGLYCGGVIGEYLEKLLDLGSPPERVKRLMVLVMGAFEQVIVTTKSAPVRPSDLDDEIFLLCALDGGADYVVSDDHSLTCLAGSYTRPIIGKCCDLTVTFGA